MIQGYAIYLRTHRETGKQYGGMCWWTKPNMTPEKACARRWMVEDKKGIRGLFGGFDSKIVLSEKRGDAPDMSDGLYRIRIFVDESKVIEHIPTKMRLNLISPLAQIQCGGLSEAILAAAHQTMRENGHYARLKKRGHYSQNGRKTVTAQVGIFAPSYDRSSFSRLVGLRHKENKTAIFAPEAMRRAATQARRTAAQMMKNKTGIFGLSMEQRAEAQKLGGNVAFEKRVGVHARTPEQMTIDGRAANATNKKAGTGFYGPLHREQSQLGAKNQSREDKARGGRTQGRISVEQKIGIHARSHEQIVVDARKGGLIGGRKNVESGQLAKARESHALKCFLKTVAWG